MRKRPVIVEGGVAYVTLTAGKTAVIDAADAELVSHRNWYAKLNRKTFYAATNIVKDGKKTSISLHRFLLDDPDYEVDHEDLDGLNCRRKNLRRASASQNAMNRSMRSDNTSGYKGVGFHKGRQKWHAMISINRRRVSLGYFDAPEVAYAAYCKAAAKHYGQFARTS